MFEAVVTWVENLLRNEIRLEMYLFDPEMMSPQ